MPQYPSVLLKAWRIPGRLLVISIGRPKMLASHISVKRPVPQQHQMGCTNQQGVKMNRQKQKCVWDLFLSGLSLGGRALLTQPFLEILSQSCPEPCLLVNSRSSKVDNCDGESCQSGCIWNWAFFAVFLDHII